MVSGLVLVFVCGLIVDLVRLVVVGWLCCLLCLWIWWFGIMVFVNSVVHLLANFTFVFLRVRFWVC